MSDKMNENSSIKHNLKDMLDSGRGHTHDSDKVDIKAHLDHFVESLHAQHSSAKAQQAEAGQDGVEKTPPESHIYRHLLLLSAIAGVLLLFILNWVIWPASPDVVADQEHRQIVSASEQSVHAQSQTPRQPVEASIEITPRHGDLKSAALPLVRNMRIAVDVANVRLDADRDAEIVARLVRDTQVLVLAEEGDWLKVRLRESDSGWLHRTLVKGVIQAPAEQQQLRDSGKVLHVIVDMGNVRRYPHPKSQIIYKLNEGTNVSLIKAEGDWRQVRLDNGVIAWGHSSIFAEGKSSQLVMRREPQQSVQRRETVVPAVPEVAATQVEDDTDPVMSEERGVSEVVNRLMKIAVAIANVREKPAANSAVAARLLRATRVFAYEKKGVWLRIRLGENRYGWIHESLVESAS